MQSSTSLTPDQRGDVTALLDRAHALVAAVRAGEAPGALLCGPGGLFDGRLAAVGHVRTAWEDAALGIRLVAARRP